MNISAVTVIIATYNQPRWLQKVLWGYDCQTYKNFDIIIADDGSGPETKAVIEKAKQETGLSITHLWHEDEGYRRQEILNIAIPQAVNDYILFTDGDCIPRNDFLATHVQFAEEGYFLSGGYCKLSMELSERISREDIYNGNSFNLHWLLKNGLTGSSQKRKLGATPFWGKFWDTVTPSKATFNNCNVSVWKKDLLRVNGYDERMKYGGSDREIGERLVNAGMKSKQIRHRAICIHLDHKRGYADREKWKQNYAIRRFTRKNKVTFTPYGIIKQA